MSTLSTIGIFISLTAMTVTLALTILVLWQSRQKTNLLFAAFLLSIAAAQLTIIIFRLGGLLIIAAGLLAFTGRLVTQVGITSDGRILYTFTPTGLALAGALISFELLALINLAVRPTALSRALIPGVGIMILAALASLIKPLSYYPINAGLVAIAAIVLTVAILREQLFDPMARLNRELGEANREMARASELKSQFLANMSHELRTPMNSIIGYTELVLSGIYGEVNDKQRDRLVKVLSNARSLLLLINDVLDLSKIEAGRVELVLEPVSVMTVLDPALTTVTPQAGEKGLRLEVNVPPDLPPILVDAARLHQIVTNLLSNAVKFTAEGAVTASAEYLRPANQVAIRVRDTGIGIPPDKLDEIFDEFRQADNTTTREFGGTGLGLAISRRLARLHGGDVTAESVMGQGSTFTVRVPVASPGPVEAATAAPPDAPLVLVIDDEAEAADIIREHLQAAGYRVEIAHSGPEGLRRARELQPAAITLDVMMPGTDGWQVLSDLKADTSTGRIPVVICSIIDSVPRSLAISVSEHVVKPINRERLLKAINRVLDSTPTQQPILVVDDNPDDRDLISTVLTSAGHTVVAVGGGQAAIDWLQQNTARLALLDLMMPGVSGFDVLAFIRSFKATRDLPVIIVSAKELTPDEEDFLDARFADVVRKQGMARDSLLGEIAAALEK